MRSISLSLFMLGMLSSSTYACSDLLSAEFRPLAGKEKVSLCERFEGKVLLIRVETCKALIIKKSSH